MPKRLISTALTVILAAFLFAGCAAISNKKTEVQRNPKELFDNAVELFLKHQTDAAETAFKNIMEEFPLSPYALESELMLGDLSYSDDRYEDAASYYTNFSTLHPSHPRAPYALFQKGMSHFKDVLTIDRDQTSTRKALFAFEDLVASYPSSEYRERAEGLIGFLRERLAEREFYVGRFYYKQKNYTGALARFRDVLKDYFDTPQVEEALFYIGESYLKLGETDLARETYSTLVNDYPQSPFSWEARKRLDSLG